MSPDEAPRVHLDGPSTYGSADEAATVALARALADVLPRDATILLDGPMGAGKTVLVRGLAAAVGVPPEVVQSPSYTLIHEYEGSRGRLVHVDLYRLDPDDLPALGLDELLEGPGRKAVEWAERLPWPVPGAVRIRIEEDGGGGRSIRIEPGAVAGC